MQAVVAQNRKPGLSVRAFSFRSHGKSCGRLPASERFDFVAATGCFKAGCGSALRGACRYARRSVVHTETSLSSPSCLAKRISGARVSSLFGRRCSRFATFEVSSRTHALSTMKTPSTPGTDRCVACLGRVDFSDALIFAISRKNGHLPLGTFDRELARVDGTRTP